MVWYSHLVQTFPQSVVIHTVKGFGIMLFLKHVTHMPSSHPLCLLSLCLEQALPKWITASLHSESTSQILSQVECVLCVTLYRHPPNTPLSLPMVAHSVGTGLEKVSFHSNPKERQCQRMLKLPHSCIHLTH